MLLTIGNDVEMVGDAAKKSRDMKHHKSRSANLDVIEERCSKKEAVAMLSWAAGTLLSASAASTGKDNEIGGGVSRIDNFNARFEHELVNSTCSASSTAGGKGPPTANATNNNGAETIKKLTALASDLALFDTDKQLVEPVRRSIPIVLRASVSAAPRLTAHAAAMPKEGRKLLARRISTQDLDLFTKLYALLSDLVRLCFGIQVTNSQAGWFSSCSSGLSGGSSGEDKAVKDGKGTDGGRANRAPDARRQVLLVFRGVSHGSSSAANLWP